MAHTPAEIGLLFADALGRGEFPEHLLAPDFTIENIDAPIVQGSYEGPEGLRQWVADFLGVFEEGTVRYAAEPTDERDEVVVAKIILTGRGRVSGAPLDLTHWGALWVTEGKVVKAVGYATRREALRGAGFVAAD